jgi:hypothetical protein
MRSIWRRHLVICCCLGGLAVPVYLIDQALFSGSGGGNWITLDFRGLLFWSYIIWLAIYVTLSSIALLFFPGARRFWLNLGLMALSLFLLVTGFAGYGKVSIWAADHRYRVAMEHRKALLNVIELKDWGYYPDDLSPTEIRVHVTVHDSGRFAGDVTGEKTDPADSTTTVFQSMNEPRDQRQVSKGDTFTYVFPLKILQAARADRVRIALYLFKAASGPATGDIAKVFINSPKEEDDGQYFYGVLPPPSRPHQMAR